MNIQFKLIISCLFLATWASAQVGLSFGPVSTLQRTIQSDTSFIDSTYNKGAGTFASTFTTSGLKFDLVVDNPTAFQINPSIPLSVTLITANYASQSKYNIGYTISTANTNTQCGTVSVGSTNTTMWNGINNSQMPWIGNSGTLFSPNHEPNLSISLFTTIQNSKVNISQANSNGWVFYNVGGTGTYMAFLEVGPDARGLDFNDGVLLIENGQVIPEPDTYALYLGVLTLCLIVYRKLSTN